MVDSPVDRVYDYYSRAQTMAVTVSTGIQGKAPFLEARYGWHWPDKQIIRLTSTPDKMEFWQDKTYARVIDPSTKSYMEYQSPGALKNPPDDFGDLFGISPVFLLEIKKDVGRKIGLKDGGRAKLGETEYDLVQLLPPEGQDQSATIDYYVDGFGRIARVNFIEMGMSGPVARYFEFKNYDLSAGAVVVPQELPQGFMPMSKPELYRPPMAGSPARFSSLFDARAKTSVDLKVNLRGKRVAVLVTAPDCVPSAKGEAAWRKLRESLLKDSCSLIEVVVDSGSGALKDLDKKDPKRPVYLDSKGEFSKLMQPPVTPYIFLVGKNGYVLHGWAGYAPDQDSKLLKTFTEAWKDAPEGF